jgi:DNA-binding LacI/PurR family transcriptional regulator
MKPIVLFLLIKFSLFAQNIYILPDEYTEIIYQLRKNIRKSRESIFIITDSFNQYTLKKELVKAAKRDINITLISASDDDKSYLQMYKNIDTKILSAIDSPRYTGKISISIIIFDNHLTCRLSTSLNIFNMQHDIALFTCKDDISFTKNILESFSSYIKRSRKYFD